MSRRRRRLVEALMRGLMLAALGLIISTLLGIVTVIALRGASALSLEMLVRTPEGGYYLGRGGGIANALVGSLYLALAGIGLAIVFGLPIALGLQREVCGRRLARLTRLCLDVLWGTPSIVYGAFGFVIMQLLGMSASLLGGIVALTLLMLPIVTRAIDEVLRMIPQELKEVPLAMGATRFEALLAVTLRQALPAMVTGVMLAFGRGIGDAASILFTAGYTDYIPRSLSDPAASLPLAVFFLSATPIAEVQRRAYAAALVLLLIVLAANLGGRLFSRRFSRHVIR